MAITFHPNVGQLLMCDFIGFKAPEMVKKRPVLVITPPHKGGSKLVTVVPLSTSKPSTIMEYHYQIPNQCLPKTSFFMNSETWIKGDMIYTVGFDRLDLIKIGKDSQGKRTYYRNKLGRDRMSDIYKCVLHGINLGDLSKHL